ncbi:Pyruvate kinase, alpha/beta domain [uncultured archaeon]|nr:Pyruvate kinase, alpha/beta domain [uncultured archaeon]
MYFEKAGKENTQRTLQIAKEEASKRGISHIVVASTFGDTGLAAAELLRGTGIKLIVVTHNTGIREPNLQTFDPEIKKKIESMGGKVHTGTMVLRGLGTALKERGSISYEQAVADTLRIFGQGTKVVVEIVAMSADAGLIPFSDVIAVAGTGRGADTAAVIKASSSNKFFDIKLREYLVKPLDF